MSEDKKLDELQEKGSVEFGGIPLIDLTFQSEKFESKEQEIEKQEIEKQEIETKNKEENNKKGKVAILPELFFLGFALLLELFFHLMRFGFKGDNLLYKLMFAEFYGLVLGTIVSIVPKKMGKILQFVLAAMITIYFVVQLIYSGVFDTYLSPSGNIEVAGQALDFTDVIGKEVWAEGWKILLLLLPFVALCVLSKKKMIRFKRRNLKSYGVQSALVLVVFFSCVGIMKGTSKELYSPYELYKNYTSVNMAVEKLGVLESLYLDTKEGMRNALGIQKKNLEFEVEENQAIVDAQAVGEALNTQGAEPDATASDGQVISIDTSPNVVDLDMDALIEEETNANIKAIHEYVNAQIPTKKNQYTGMFEGYNLVFVVAEGFSGYVIDQERTPMLYKMSREGFVFRNYYTPLWYGSTLGGEYANLTGLMPKNGTYLSMTRAGNHNNDMYFTLSRQLERQGYSVRGYHNNDYKYYDRNISHPNMGYEWKGMGNGLEYEKENGESLWPQSDLRMIDDTVDEYVSDQPFHTYYLTVSGHVMYNYGGNAMANRHKDIVDDLDYSDTTKAYIACQYELELAMEELVDKLEVAGVLDHTLIVLTADHVPYDDKEVVDELAGETLDKTFDWYKNNLIIWSASMEEPVIVEKCCSSLDILPTVSNLMGLTYDSRMMIGQDILSGAEGLVLFNDRSFMTDNMSYNANTKEVNSFHGAVIGEDYVEAMKVVVKNKFSMADAMNENDYYRYIHEALDRNDTEK